MMIRPLLILVHSVVMASISYADYWQATYRNAIYAVAHGNETYVALGRYSNAHWSSDGVHWWATTTLEGGIEDVCFGNGMFVAVGGLGKIFRSVDGREWIECASPAEVTLTAIAWSGSAFVAVGSRSEIYRSVNGIDWTAVSIPTEGVYQSPGILKCVAYGNGAWVAMSASNYEGIRSTDGINWTSIRLGSGHNEKLIFANGRFAAVTKGRSQASVAQSEDGITWTAVSSGYEDLESIVYLPEVSKWVILADSGKLFLTSDLETLTETGNVGSIVHPSGAGMTYADGKVVVVMGSQTAISEDGVNWSYRSSPPSAGFKCGCWHKGKYLVGGASGVLGTFDEVDGYTPANIGGTDIWIDMASNGEVCVAVSRYGSRILTTSDGVNWIETTPEDTGNTAYSVSVALGNFIICGSNWTQTFSPDGYNWTVDATPRGNLVNTYEHFYAVTTNNDNSEAIGITNYGGIYHSPDLINWTRVNEIIGATRMINKEGKLLVLGYGVSYDNGITWVQQPVPFGEWMSDVAFVNGHFLATARNNGGLFSSVDGLYWQRENTGLENSASFMDIVVGGERTLIVEDYGYHLLSERKLIEPSDFDEFWLEMKHSGELGLRFSENIRSGAIMDLQSSHDMNAGSWQTILRNITPGGGSFIPLDLEGNESAMFFRFTESGSVE